MRKQTLIRFGLSTVMLASGATACFAVGCSDDDNAVTPVADGGNKDTGGFGDTGTADTGPGMDSGPTEGGNDGGLKHAKIIAVHGSAFAPGFRFCFAVGTKADGTDGVVGPLPALPHDDSNLPAGVNYPALYPGTGGAFPDLTDLEPKALTPYLIPMPNAAITTDVKSNANERTCDALIGASGGGGVLHPIGADGAGDYFKLPTIAANTFVKGKTFLLGLVGCLPGNTGGAGGATVAAAQCGSTYDIATGNLQIKIFTLDRTVADSTKLGLQVLDLSQAIDGIVGLPTAFGGANGVITGAVGIDLATRDGGSPANAPVGAAIKYGDFTPAAAAPQTYAATDYTAAIAYDQLFVTNDAGTNPVKLIPLPFGVIQTLTYGRFGDAGLPGPNGQPLYLPGANYTLVIMGDPSAAHQLTMTVDGGGQVPDPQYDGRGVHMMMFPNDPPLPAL